MIRLFTLIAIIQLVASTEVNADIASRCNSELSATLNENLRSQVIAKFGTELVDNIASKLQVLDSHLQTQIPSIASLTSDGRGNEFDLAGAKAEYALRLTAIDINDDMNEIDRAMALHFNISNRESALAAMASDPHLEEMVLYLNNAFQSTQVIMSFVEELLWMSLMQIQDDQLDRTLMIMKAHLGTHSFSRYSVFGTRDVHAALMTMAKSLGWSDAVEIEPGDMFFEKSLAVRKLPIDVEYLGEPHTQQGHMIQLVLASRLIRHRFGIEREAQFMAFLATQHGRGIWNLLFDRGPNFFRDMRGPRFFYSDYSRLGLGSILGLR